MGKNIGYYPKGDINQHKSLATGAGLRQCDKRDLGGGMKAGGGMGKGGKISSSGDTGSGYKSTPPKSSPVTPP